MTFAQTCPLTRSLKVCLSITLTRQGLWPAGPLAAVQSTCVTNELLYSICFERDEHTDRVVCVPTGPEAKG